VSPFAQSKLKPLLTGGVKVAREFNITVQITRDNILNGCPNYIARTDMWNALNGWRFTGPVDNPLPAPEHNDGETKTLDA